ncbi:MAG: TolC family protein, partial [Verrucomicrobiota bacterium]
MSPLVRQLGCAAFLLLVAAAFSSGCKTLEQHLDEDVVATTEVPERYDRPSYGNRVRPDWWCLFGDSQLNGYMSDLVSESFTLKAGLARVDQAYAVLGIAAADRVPSVNGSGSITRNRFSQNDFQGQFTPSPWTTQYQAALGLSWEIDLWGRVRRSVEGASADAAEAESLLEDLKLSLQSQLARNYFTLRFLDEERRVLAAAVETRVRNLDLARKRFEGEFTSELDVARAETELAATRADLARLIAPRAKL